MVADASLIPRGGTASARLALAWSSQRLLLWGCRGTVAAAACRTVPRPGRGTSRAQGLVLRMPSRLADLEGSTQRASTSDSRGPGAAGGWAGDHGTRKSSSDDWFGSKVPLMLTRARAHNSRPHYGRTSSMPHIARQRQHDVPVPPLDAASTRTSTSDPRASRRRVQAALNRRSASR